MAIKITENGKVRYVNENSTQDINHSMDNNCVVCAMVIG